MAAFNFHQRRTRRWWYAGVTAVVAAAFAIFMVAGAGAVLPGSPSQFESGDGNMTVESTTDWASTSVLNSTDYKHVSDPASTQSDDAFVSGQKQDTVCPDTYQHGNPPKDDFTDVASYFEVSGAGVPFLYGATIRYASNGSASENVELKQGTSGTCSNGLLARTAGDKLLAFDYTGGGSSVDLHVLTWITPSQPNLGQNNGTCFVANDPLPCWGANVLHPTSVEGSANPDPITAAHNPIGGTDLKAGQFAEFGVNLQTAGIIPAGTCFATAQTIWESRSSGSSFVSTTKDIVIENQPYSNCGEVRIIKHTSPAGLNQDFGYTTTGGLSPSSFTLNDKSFTISSISATDPAVVTTSAANVFTSGQMVTISGSNSSPTADGTWVATVTDSTHFSIPLDLSTGTAGTTGSAVANMQDYVNVPQGSYTVTEGSDPSGFTFASVTCTNNGSGGTTSSTSNKTATIKVQPDKTVTCTYINNQQLGVIKVYKSSTKTSAALQGATFTITKPDSTTATITTGSDGYACLADLPYGNYSVQETGAPSGYKINDSTSHTVTVGTNTTCSAASVSLDTSSNALNFSDTPLSTIQVIFTSLGKASGSSTTPATAASIVCKDANNTVISPVSENGAADPAYDDTDETYGNGTSTLVPGTYTCTVVIDP